LPSPAEQFENEEFLLYRLPAVARRASRICAAEYESKFGLTMKELRLIAQIGRFGGVSAKEICDKISVDQVAISRAVIKCVRRGLVREKPNPRDRRSKTLVLTALGEKFYQRFLPEACALAALMENGLTVAETRVLKKLLKKLDAHLVTLIPQWVPMSETKALSLRE
jgi:DNA-binding MarR family transcriptional regulator